MTSDGLARLAELADRQATAEARVDELQEDLKRAKAEVAEVAEKLIPDLMDELEVSEFTTRSGLKVTVGERVVCPQLRNAEGLEWLRDHGQGGLIKSQVVVPFTRGDDTDAAQLVERLRGEGLSAQHDSHVVWNTLASAIKSMREDGEVVPMELFRAHDLRRAKVESKG